MTDKDDYGKISESLKQVVIDDLKEDPARVNEQIDELRKWATSMPHFNCPTDSNFLLRFLRVAKFDIKAAQQQLDSFCTIRCSYRGTPEYFDYANIDDAMINEFLDSKVFTPLGRNKDGEMIIFIPIKFWNPDTIPRYAWITLIYMAYDLIQSEEESQLHGVRLFLDLSNTSPKIAEAWNDNKYLKEVSRVHQDILPWLFKGQVTYNVPRIFEEIMKKWKFYLTKNLPGKIIQTSDLEVAFANIPGLKDLLPKEYGGCGSPLETISKKWNETFKAYYKDGDQLKDITVDESIRHEDTLTYLDDYPEYEE